MTLFKLFLSFLPSLGCLGIAGFLVINGVSGWGWFLFGALILYPRWKGADSNE